MPLYTREGSPVDVSGTSSSSDGDCRRKMSLSTIRIRADVLPTHVAYCSLRRAEDDFNVTGMWWLKRGYHNYYVTL